MNATSCVKVGPTGCINDKWHHLVTALKRDKRMEKNLKNAVSGVAVQPLLVPVLNTSRAVHYKTAGLRSGEINQWQILPSAILITNRKPGVGRESMRQLVCMLMAYDAIQIPRSVFPDSRSRFRLQLWTVGLLVLGN